jgi:hypothetical protein
MKKPKIKTPLSAELSKTDENDNPQEIVRWLPCPLAVFDRRILRDRK